MTTAAVSKATSSPWSSFAVAPHDVLFFRDGKPSTRGEDHYLRSIFPPYPSTVYGALRTRRLQEESVDLTRIDESTWGALPAPLREELGSWGGFGSLTLRGPWLVSGDARGGRVLLPAPSDLRLVLAPTAEPSTGSPRAERVMRDGFPAKPRANGTGWSHPLARWPRTEEPPRAVTAEEWFLDAQGWRAWACGGVPEPAHFVHRDALWGPEERTGVGLESNTRSSAEGLLYTFGFVRLALSTRLGFEVASSGLSPYGDARLGGEARTADLAPGPAFPAHPSLPSGRRRFVVAVATPMLARHGAYPPGFGPHALEGELGGVGCRLLAARVRGSVNVGGWDLVRHRAKPLRRAIPPGSVFLFEALEGDAASAVNALWGTTLSDWNDSDESLARQGFGLVLAGLDLQGD